MYIILKEVLRFDFLRQGFSSKVLTPVTGKKAEPLHLPGCRG
jgi:hypothetical protein